MEPEPPLTHWAQPRGLGVPGRVAHCSQQKGQGGRLARIRDRREKGLEQTLGRPRKVSLLGFCKLSPLPQGVSAPGPFVKEQT